MKRPTLEQLQAWTPEERMRVRQRAAQFDNAEAKATVELIDNSGLPLRTGGGMSFDHPLYREMEEVIWSAEGKSAALDAVGRGLPAMAGVDPLLQKRMGNRYSADQQGTMNAGWIVAELMRSRGYEPEGSASLPPGSVAKTAALYRAKSSLR